MTDLESFGTQILTILCSYGVVSSSKRGTVQLDHNFYFTTKKG